MVSSDGAVRRYDYAKVKAEFTHPKAVRWLLDRLQLEYIERGELSYVQGWPALGGDSFCVFGNGTFKCFREESPERKGDMIALTQLVRRESSIDALKWIYGELGWAEASGRRLTAEELAARDAEARRRREQREREDEAKRTKKQKALTGRYLGLRFAEGTIVQTYLEASRGIDFEALGGVTRTLRYQDDAVYYYDYARDKDWNELLPAMVAPFFREGKIVGLHYTYLKRDGRAKAALGTDDKGKAWPSKKMQGQQGIIPLHKGAGNLSAGDALKRGVKGVLAICEGIEDALTVAMARPDYRVWAVGSKSGFHIPWPDIASGVVLVADNDGDSEEEQERNFAAVRAHWEGQANGRPLGVARAAYGKDFNDWLNKNDN